VASCFSNEFISSDNSSRVDGYNNKWHEERIVSSISFAMKRSVSSIVHTFKRRAPRMCILVDWQNVKASLVDSRDICAKHRNIGSKM